MQYGDYREQGAYLPASTAFLGCSWGINISDIEELIINREAEGKKIEEKVRI
jgi:hypothetical protein